MIMVSPVQKYKNHPLRAFTIYNKQTSKQTTTKQENPVILKNKAIK